MQQPRFLIDDQRVAGFAGAGTFAEEAIYPQSAAIRIDREYPLDVSALIGCAVITGVGASINTAQVRPGSSVVVFGAGGIGISAIQGARVAGAAEIVAVDQFDTKLELARHFGATHGVRPEQLEEVRQEITGGQGFDYALECVGHAGLIRQTFDVVRRGGTAVLVGVGRADEKVAFNAFELFFTEKNLRGCVYGSANPRVDFDRILRLWKHGQLDLDAMVSRRIRLEDVNDAFEDMQRGGVIRSLIVYD